MGLSSGLSSSQLSSYPGELFTGNLKVGIVDKKIASAGQKFWLQIEQKFLCRFIQSQIKFNAKVTTLTFSIECRMNQRIKSKQLVIFWAALIYMSLEI